MRRRRVPAKRALWIGLAVLGLVVLSSCPLSGWARRRELAVADAACRAIVVGTPVADAERALGTLGATELGAMTSPRQDVAYGIRGDLVSWECTIDLDDGRTVVRGTRFHWWVPPDFHGGWDDDLREWIERTFY